MILIENRTKYVLGAVIFFLVLIGVVVVFQQITINNLKKGQTGENATALLKSAAINSPFTVQAVKKNLEDTAKVLNGTIASKQGNIITVDADIVDFSKLSGLTEDQLHQSLGSFPKTKKRYEVSVSDKTQFDSLKLNELLQGMAIEVMSDDLVYKSDHLNASKITVQPTTAPGVSFKDSILQTKEIAGQIKEINAKYLIVSVMWTDFNNVDGLSAVDPLTVKKIAKEYKVLIDNKTQFTDKKLSDLRVRQTVRAHALAPVYSLSEFTASQIDGPILVTTDLPYFDGHISEIGNNSLKVKTSDNNGGKTYTVKIVDKTLFCYMDSRGVPSNETEIVTEGKNISDFQVNDEVTILSLTRDIENKSEITAQSVCKNLR